jgi:hypothetical protein
MKSVFKKANTLNKDEIDQIYLIHKHVYFGKQIGLEKNNWVNNLKIKYHDRCDKQIQIFYTDNCESICGYNIFLEPAIINGNQWSKIIEGGALPIIHKNTCSTFLNMYSELICWYKNLNFIGETSVDFKGVKKLLIKSGFIPSKEISIVDEIFTFFLNSHNYVLHSDVEGCLVSRETAIKSNYIGNILIYAQKDKIA